jgi:glutathione S-transferase
VAITLYSTVYCPYAWCTRTVMHEKGVAYATVEVDPNDTRARPMGEAAGSSFSTFQALPAFEDGDVKLSDSVVICEYLEEKYPRPDLMGANPTERAEVRSVLWDLNVRRTQPLAKLAAMLYYDRTSRDQDCVERQLKRWGAYLDELDEHFRGSRWLAIGRFSVADISAYTTVAVSRGLGANVTRGRRHLREWLGRMDARSSVIAAAPESMPKVA